MATKLLQLYDYGTDLKAKYGVEIGAVHLYLWESLNPGYGAYNWDKMEAQIAAEAALGKPVLVQVMWSISQNGYAWPYGYDATPTWVYPATAPVANGRPVGHIITTTGVQSAGLGSVVQRALNWLKRRAGVSAMALNGCAIPAYDNYMWRDRLYTFAAALGKRWDGDPRICGFSICTGIDGEDQAAKGQWASRIQGTAIERYFGEFVMVLMERFRAAFPRTPCYILNAPSQGMRMPTTLKAQTLGQGVGHNGLTVDLDSHEGGGNFVGSWDHMRYANQNNVPVKIESAMWIPNPPAGQLTSENGYWSIWAALHYRPVLVDLHSDWFGKIDPSLLKYFAEHIGVSVAESEDVWSVLRDSEFPVKDWGTGRCSGHKGNWEFGLVMDPASDAPRVMRDALPAGKADIRARQCRRLRWARWTPDEAWTPARMEVEATVLNEDGKLLSCTFPDGERATIRLGAEQGAVGAWIPVTFGGTRGVFSLACDEGLYVHRVAAWRLAPLPEPTPDPEPPSMEKLVGELCLHVDDLQQRMGAAEARLGAAETRITQVEKALADVVRPV